MPNSFSYPPSGFDRADGLNSQPGTATPAGVVRVASANGAITINDIQLEELPTSPIFERAEQATIRHQFRCALTNGFTLLAALGRGTILMDSFGNITRVLSAEVQPEKPTMCILTITAEGINFDSPPDEFCCVPEQLGVWIVKHPRYFYALDGFAQIIGLINDFNSANIIAVKDSLASQIVTTAIPTGKSLDEWRLACAAALEILEKMSLNIDTPYIPGYRITWSQYFWVPPYLCPGAFIQDPILEGGLPDYFWSTDSTGNYSTNLFALFGDFNPQDYRRPDGGFQISWLRQADELEYVRTWFKVTKTWIGSPIGHWDVDIYTADLRPTQVQDYHNNTGVVIP